MSDKKIRPVFIYLTIIAVALGVVGFLNITGYISLEIDSGEEIYSIGEISDQDNYKSCWIAIDDKVYDITLLLQLYPEDLPGRCGEKIEKTEFSEEIIKMLGDYKIGSLR